MWPDTSPEPETGSGPEIRDETETEGQRGRRQDGPEGPWLRKPEKRTDQLPLLALV